MTEFETLDLSIDPRGVARLTLDRTDKRNALSGVMIAELVRATAMLGAMEDVRAVVLAAAGPVFCAGGDLDWMKAQIEADRASRIKAARELAHMLKALNEMPKPLIGRVHGDAFGGGVGMMCVCDVAVAAQGTRFALPETRLGLIPATIGPYVVARLGEGPARRVFMSSRVFDAEEARDLGLVAETAAPDELDAAIERHVVPYLAVAPGAVGRAKALARALGPRIDDAVIEQTVCRLADAWETDEAAEGISAFLEKRRPRWA